MKIETLSRILAEKHGKDFRVYVAFCVENQYSGEEYTETHHILPKCTFPEYAKEEWNLVTLKYTDHIEAHTLLAEACPIRRYMCPLNFMLQQREEYKKRYSDICKENWAEFKKSPGYQKWYEKRKKYCDEVFVRGGERYSHMLEMARRGNTPDARSIKSEKMKLYWDDPEKREEQRERVLAHWTDPKHREKTVAGIQKSWDNASPERRKAAGEVAKRPDVRKKNSEGVKRAYQNPEVKERHRKGLVGLRWWTDETKSVKARECPGPGWRLGRSKTEMRKIIDKREANRNESGK